MARTSGSGPYAALAASSTAAGIHANTDSPTYGKWFTFGNAPNSNGGATTGTPAEGWGPFVAYQKFGDYTGLTNADVTKTTQAGYFVASYYGRTVDDSAEALSAAVLLKDTGIGFTQAKKVVAFEADVQIEGANTVTGASTYVLGQGSRIIMNDTSNADTGYGAKMSAATKLNRVNSASGTLGVWRAFFDEAYNPAGSSPANNHSFYGVNRIQSEQALYAARTSFGGAVTIDLAGTLGGMGANAAIVNIQQPSPATTTSIADGGIVSGSNLVTTATAPAASWIGRILANANLPAGVQVMNYYGAGPYTLVLSANATGTASSQTVTITEPDLVGIKIVQGVSGTQRAMEIWQQGVTGAPVISLGRTGVIGAQGGVQAWSSAGAAQISLTTSGLQTNVAGLEASGAGSAALGANCPAVTATAPYTWMKAKTSDGSVVYIPVWK